MLEQVLAAGHVTHLEKVEGVLGQSRLSWLLVEQKTTVLRHRLFKLHEREGLLGPHPSVELRTASDDAIEACGWEIQEALV